VSSTGRGTARSPSDFYPTAPWIVHRLLESPAFDPLGLRWLEPSSGDGAIIRAVDAWRKDAGKPSIEWTAVDIRNECKTSLAAATGDRKRVIIGDFLSPRVQKSLHRLPQFDVIFTNPPFLLGTVFLTASLKIARNVVFLMRQGFLASEERADFMRQHVPDVFQLPNRPSFAGQGKTDSCEYAWMKWRATPVTSGHLVILNSTPRNVRAREEVR